MPELLLRIALCHARHFIRLAVELALLFINSSSEQCLAPSADAGFETAMCIPRSVTVKRR